MYKNSLIHYFLQGDYVIWIRKIYKIHKIHKIHKICKIVRFVRFIRFQQVELKVKTGIILGSGLTKFAMELELPKIILEDNSGFHKRTIISGEINGNDVVVFSGRRHFYEGYSESEVLENVNIADELGVNSLIITNAAGGINKNFKVSDLMLITSHVNFQTKNSVFNKSSNEYSKKSVEAIKSIAIEHKINLRYGCYCCTFGPMYESKSEIRYLTKLGIDAVGMSTVPEILHAKKLGMKEIAISCITNILSEQSEQITTHDEVLKAGNDAYHNFSKLLKGIISNSF